MTLIAAIVQAEATGILASALEQTRALAVEAVAAGADLVAFPETWIPGYPVWLDVCRDAGLWNHPPVKELYRTMAEHSVVVDGSSASALGTIARDCGATLVMGVVERVPSGTGYGTLYNTLLTYGPDGALLNHHRKLVPTYTERLLWGQGDADGVMAVDTPVGRVGGLICWEHWMPLARQAMHQSGEAIHVAVWPTVHEMHQVASRQYAFEGRCVVLAAGGLLQARNLPSSLEPHPDRVTGPDQWVMRGGSAIIGPDGQYVVEPVYDTPEILLAEIDLDDCRREQMTLDVGGHYARPDCFSFTVQRGRRQ